MNRKEVIEKFYEAAQEQLKKHGSVDIHMSSKYCDNGLTVGSVITAKNGHTFIFGMSDNENECHTTCFSDPDTTEDLHEAIEGMFDAGTDTDYDTREDLVFEKVPRVNYPRPKGRELLVFASPEPLVYCQRCRQS